MYLWNKFCIDAASTPPQRLLLVISAQAGMQFLPRSAFPPRPDRHNSIPDEFCCVATSDALKLR